MSVPKIGITTFINEDKLTIPTNYIRAVSESDGTPLILPKISKETQIKEQIENIDALLLTGGDDIDPSLFGEDPHPALGNIEPGRDEYELKLIEMALSKDMPILAICRGAQILNVSQGGSMLQDIYDQTESPVIQHQQKAPKSHLSHAINIAQPSLLFDIIGADTIMTNSFHHQANSQAGKGFHISAETNDGIVEAIESTVHKFVLALQWHSEACFATDENSRKIFRAFIESAIE